MNVRLILLALCACTLGAQTMEWSAGDTIEMGMPVATSENTRIRELQIPGGSITQVTSAVQNDPNLQISWNRNLLTLRLLTAGYSTDLTVWDDQDNTYFVSVFQAPDESLIDRALILRKRETLEDRALRARRRDTDSSTIHLMAVAAGGVQDRDYTSAPITSYERGKVIKGQNVMATDTLQTSITRMWSSPIGRLACYETTWSWHGEKPFVVNFQSLWFPGVVAACPSSIAVMPNTRPEVTIPPQSTLRIYYVYVEPAAQ